MVAKFIFTFFFSWVFYSGLKPFEVGVQVFFLKKKKTHFLLVGNRENFTKV